MVALPEAQQDIIDLLAGLSESDLERPTGHTAWTVREAFAHIIDSTEMLAGCLERAKVGKEEGTLNPAEMAPAMERDAIIRAHELPDRTAIEAAFNKAAEHLMGLLKERAANESWEGPVPHPYLGTCPAVQIAGFALLDWFIHPWDIRDALGQQPQPRPSHAALLVGGLVNLLPRRLDQKQAAKLPEQAIYRYISQSEPPMLFEVIVDSGKARVEQGQSEVKAANLVFEGKPGELVLAMLGRRSAAPLLKQSSPEDLQRFKTLWISL